MNDPLPIIPITPNVKKGSKENSARKVTSKRWLEKSVEYVLTPEEMKMREDIARETLREVFNHQSRETITTKELLMLLAERLG